MESWIQFAGLFLAVVGTVGGLGFFFLRVSERLDRTIERLDRNYDGIQKELRDMYKERRK
jgi:hypothetical protein